MQPVEPALSAGASLSYLALLVAVVGPNATTMRETPGTVAVVVGLALILNITGYLLAMATRRLTPDRSDHTAMLFTVSKKEFSIAAFGVFASGLPAEVALPAVVYAVVQMITSPIVARRRAASRDHAEQQRPDSVDQRAANRGRARPHPPIARR